MSQLRAALMMIEALRLEIRAATYLQNRGEHARIQEAWLMADQAAAAAREELDRVEQEAEACGREDRVDTSHLT